MKAFPSISRGDAPNFARVLTGGLGAHREVRNETLPRWSLGAEVFVKSVEDLRHVAGCGFSRKQGRIGNT